MQPFKLTLDNDSALSGLYSIPPNTSPGRPRYCPLIVGIHGASYKSSYFDVTPAYSARLTSQNYGIPFVAIDRPGYGESTSVEPVPEGSTFGEEWGIWLHRYILPRLWKEFGQPNSCTCIVLHCHSLGSNGAIVAAALHAADPEAVTYPLGGVVISGFGSLAKDGPAHAEHDPNMTHINIPSEIKNLSLLLPGTAEPEIYTHTERLSQPMPMQEVLCLRKSWLPTWRAKWALKVKAPLMIGLAEQDNFWPGTEEHLKDFAGSFTNSRRVDVSLIKGAPHNIELSYWSRGWYARSFGFAMECAAKLGVDESV